MVNCSPGLPLNRDPLGLSLPSSWDYRPEPPMPHSMLNFKERKLKETKVKQTEWSFKTNSPKEEIWKYCLF
jgi:hypothetical protein